ncbi:hypothetical protein [Streptosporangium lutulentum]|uniref:Immunity protein 10 n=1 Tax=Streptosporangium lutulentum TaxID=1461250 RepID=A0ABT9QSP8_9ACTN|nr:hypothetical protein [Streptosporangium lutulentum]MDP9849733.1 hypothetical protein [Streptosporangium lutulentum]
MNLEPDTVLGWRVVFDMDASGDDALDRLPDDVALEDSDQFLYQVHVIRTTGCTPQEHLADECGCWDFEVIGTLFIRELPERDLGFFPDVEIIKNQEVCRVVTDWLKSA